MSLTINQQAFEKPERVEDGSLDVVNVWPTIQGEGPFAGRRAVFVRLAGCNLRCPWCDTDYTSHRQRYSVDELWSKVKRVVTNAGWESGNDKVVLVLTGGEPFRQNIVPFVWTTLGHFDVQIETNGTLWLDEFSNAANDVTIVCSPKTPSINEDLANWVDAWKYILDADHVAEDGLPSQTLGLRPPARPVNSDAPVYVQPADVQDEAENKRHTAAALASCLQYGYRFCLQVHKYVGAE